MVDFLRMNQVHIMELVAFIFVICLIFWVVKKSIKLDYQTRRLMNIIQTALIALAVLGFVLGSAHMAVLNETPRSAIDRSVTNERARRLQSDSHKQAQEPMANEVREENK